MKYEMKSATLKLVRFLGGRWILKTLNRGLRRFSAMTHYFQYVLEWGVRPVPGWFDHYLDLHYLWHKTRTPLSWERGIFNLLAISEGAKVLELCCGDGFNAYYFYSIRASCIVALDLDAEAIQSAGRYYVAPNLHYAVADIRTQMPDELFDNIVWDASLEYFTEAEIEQLMRDIKARLGVDGVLSGYSIVQNYRHDEHKYIFRSKEDLLGFLQPYFRNVRIFETRYPSRHNLYFFASEGGLPFDAEWPLQKVSCRL